MAQKYFGVMTVNITGVELVIVNLKTHKSLEKVSKDINLGDDIYRNRPVQFESVNRLVEALTGFIQILHDYDVENYQLWGSQGLSQAINADFIADQFYLHTGLEINWLSISDEAYYRNQNISLELEKQQENVPEIVYLVGITSGNTSITRFDNGKFVTSTNFSLGPIKIAEDLDSLRRSAPNSIGVLNDYIDSKLKDFDRGGQVTLLPDNNKETQVILLGTSSIKKMVAEYTHDSTEKVVSINVFRDLLDDIVDASDQYLIEQLMIHESATPLVLPELLLTRRILQLTNAKTLRFSDSSVIDGVVNNEEVALGFSKHDFSNQTIKMAVNLANHYNVEPVHREIVTKFARHLFNQLKPLHMLGKREAVLLEVASILHDVGNYISVHSHYVHSEYIIRNSDIIGLSQEEKEIVAAIAKYHSATTPSADLSHFSQISAENRRLISKLAAILRLVDALDDDRQQKIEKISVSIKTHHVIISAYSNANLAYENWVFNSKSQFFQETYGLKPVLKQKGVKS
ncbi:Ppx/GppA phosphatase family protein [Weissella bombi]|uniref:Exopolyphosphatase / guanosine-5'-triphosphate,3'-diphosphate pyrophosphatase n=1 Tax=Weissella bombi TaxID=1505725 RepID=A0A1C4C5Z3_9LACO|nr:HD domain-containing protein [Weissella bombi]SCC14414.1 exopolyphosphatase / guanosine-5'-triphosphate,3'-diphosphate pyrophosphatase [Weissella bombi]